MLLAKQGAVWAALGIFAVEALINFRQARLNDRHRQETSKGDWNNDGAVQNPEDFRRARLILHFRTTTASHSMLMVLLFAMFDVAPRLWALMGNIQTLLPPFFGSEFWRSCLFLLSCCAIYLAVHAPNFAWLSVILKENVWAEFVAQFKSTWKLHELAGDNVIPSVLLVITASILIYQAIGIQFTRSYVLLFGASQLTFGIFYPILNQPKKKYLSLLESGNLKDEIDKLALSAKVKLRNIYIGTGPLPKDFEDGVQTFGWPLHKHLSIHESVIEECTTEDIKALTAQQFGCWKAFNNMRASFFSHVRLRSLPPLIRSEAHRAC